MTRDHEEPTNPVLSDEMNAKGIEFAERGWIDEAINYFRKAIELDPSSGHAWDNLAGVLAEKSRWREALFAHLKSLDLEPDSAAGHFNLAGFIVNHGLDIAESELREALEIDPDYPDGRLSLGMVLADMGQTEDAIKELEAAAESYPEDAYSRHELALLLLEQNDIRGAINLLREVVAIEPDNFEAYLELGICFGHKGFYAEAERSLNTALSLRPESVHALYGMASLHSTWEKDDEALGLLERASELDASKVIEWLKTDPAFERIRDKLPEHLRPTGFSE